MEEQLKDWQQYVYEPKHIWFKGAGGDKVGIYYVRALAIRQQGEQMDARVLSFDFRPHQQQTGLYVSQFLNEQRQIDLERIPTELKTALKAYVRLLLEYPKDWKAGKKVIHSTIAHWGTFYIRQQPALIPSQYKELLELPEAACSKVLTHEHPLFQLLNNETKGFDSLLRDSL